VAWPRSWSGRGSPPVSPTRWQTEPAMLAALCGMALLGGCLTKHDLDSKDNLRSKGPKLFCSSVVEKRNCSRSYFSESHPVAAGDQFFVCGWHNGTCKSSTTVSHVCKSLPIVASPVPTILTGCTEQLTGKMNLRQAGSSHVFCGKSFTDKRSCNKAYFTDSYPPKSAAYLPCIWEASLVPGTSGKCKAATPVQCSASGSHKTKKRANGTAAGAAALPAQGIASSVGAAFLKLFTAAAAPPSAAPSTHKKKHADGGTASAAALPPPPAGAVAPSTQMQTGTQKKKKRTNGTVAATLLDLYSASPSANPGAAPSAPKKKKRANATAPMAAVAAGPAASPPAAGAATAAPASKKKKKKVSN